MSWKVGVEFKPSIIDGMGAFALQPILRGTKIWGFDYRMHVCDATTLMALPPDLLHFALHGGYLHHPSGKFVWYDDGMHFVNHAFPPNANIGIMEWTPLEEDCCIALRDIERGEELLEDYSFWSAYCLTARHWLRKLYMRHCPKHFAFLNSLEVTEQAA